jgi:hypothetical protein
MRFHEGEITTMSMLENTVFTGCIDGYVFATNLTKCILFKLSFRFCNNWNKEVINHN